MSSDMIQYAVAWAFLSTIAGYVSGELFMDTSLYLALFVSTVGSAIILFHFVNVLITDRLRGLYAQQSHQYNQPSDSQHTD